MEVVDKNGDLIAWSEDLKWWACYYERNGLLKGDRGPEIEL